MNTVPTPRTPRSAAELPIVAAYDLTLVDRNLWELFESQVEDHSAKVAVIGPDRSLTYGELRSRALRVSAFLRLSGLGSEQPVGVFMARTADVVAVLLGILHAGGCYVPLDPAEPAERARSLASRARLSTVLGDPANLQRFRDAVSSSGPDEHDPTLVDVGSIVGANAVEVVDGVEVSACPPCAPGGNRLAYIMFTSGSTGAPKGVEVEHRNVINLLLAAGQAFEFTDVDRYLAVSTLAFDISVVEVFLPLIRGASLVLGDRQLLLERGAVAAAIVRHGVTVFQTGPSVWALLLESSTPFPRLRIAITTGEAMAPALAHRLAGVGELVWNLYGPTETTIWCTGQRIDTPTGLDECTSVAAPIGHMWPAMPGIIVDDEGNEVADGEQGDLWVGGLAVTRGYKDNAALTQERYVQRSGDPDRYYRTGDIVSRASNGVLRFFGRNDDQVQIHGVRIEPMEVEEALRSDPYLEHVAATWFVNRAGARAIVAGVVIRDGMSTTGPEISARLAARLPAAMVPSRFVFYDALPLTPNGKTDRLVLRADASSSPTDVGGDGVEEEELTLTERALRDIWTGLLGLPQVVGGDNFFSIGGDSLAAVAMVQDAEDVFGVSITVQAVIEYPTLRELAAFVDRRTGGMDSAPDPQFTFQLVRGGAASPVFFCAIELNLAREGAWRIDCPLYSVNYWTLGAGFSRARSLEQLAAKHVSEIKTIQPKGPYRIAGFSFGGIVALEIAHELRRLGDEIELLFLLDPTEPYRTSAAPSVERIDGVDLGLAQTRRDRERIVHRVVRHSVAMAREYRSLGPYVRDKARLAPVALLAHTDAWPWIHYRLVDLHGRFPNSLTARLLPQDRWIGFWYVAKRLARRYVAVPFAGPTLAVFLEQNDRLASWRGLLPEAGEVRVIAGNHDGLTQEPSLTEWMDLLARHLPPGPAGNTNVGASAAIHPTVMGNDPSGSLVVS